MIVAIAGNAVENVVGVQLAARNKADFAVSVIVNSSLQVALALTPVLVFASLLFATHLTLVFPTLLALVLADRRRSSARCRQRRRVDVAGGRRARRLLRRDRGELLVGDLAERRAGQRDQVLRRELDLQAAPSGADEDRLPLERGRVDHVGSRRRWPSGLIPPTT